MVNKTWNNLKKTIQRKLKKMQRKGLKKNYQRITKINNSNKGGLI